MADGHCQGSFDCFFGFSGNSHLFSEYLQRLFQCFYGHVGMFVHQGSSTGRVPGEPDDYIQMEMHQMIKYIHGGRAPLECHGNVAGRTADVLADHRISDTMSVGK